MLPDVVRRLRCPVCGQPLAESGAGPGPPLRCPQGHTFDRARQGYVNLLTGRTPHAGDTAEMVAAREEFLSAGHYGLISSALAEAAARATATRADSGSIGAEGSTGPGAPLVVDAGAGTGRHLAAVLDVLPDAVGLALDVSKPALRRAARSHPRTAAALADTWRSLPVADGAAALLLNVFAPRNGPEFHRILHPDGALLVVTPAEDHLTELVGVLDLLRVDPAKQERVAGSLAGHFDRVGGDTRRRVLELTRAEVRTLVGMGPSAWHTEPERLVVRLATLPEPVRVTVAVELGVHRPR